MKKKSSKRKKKKVKRYYQPDYSFLSSSLRVSGTDFARTSSREQNHHIRSILPEINDIFYEKNYDLVEKKSREVKFSGLERNEERPNVNDFDYNIERSYHYIESSDRNSGVCFQRTGRSNHFLNKTIPSANSVYDDNDIKRPTIGRPIRPKTSILLKGRKKKLVDLSRPKSSNPNFYSSKPRSYERMKYRSTVIADENLARIHPKIEKKYVVDFGRSAGRSKNFYRPVKKSKGKNQMFYNTSEYKKKKVKIVPRFDKRTGRNRQALWETTKLRVDGNYNPNDLVLSDRKRQVTLVNFEKDGGRSSYFNKQAKQIQDLSYNVKPRKKKKSENNFFLSSGRKDQETLSSIINNSNSILNLVSKDMKRLNNFEKSFERKLRNLNKNKFPMYNK